MNYDISPENINYLKFVYHDDDGFRHCIKASIKKFDYRELYACAKFEDDLYIKTPQEVELGVICNDGLYTCETTMKYIQRENEFIYFAFKSPNEWNYKQDREFFRVRLDNEAIIYYVQNEKKQKTNAKIYDISASGVRLQLNENIILPDDVQISLSFPKKQVHTLAKFIRTDSEDKILKAAFTFVDLSQQDMDYISQICLQKQIEERRKNKLI